MSQSPAPDGSQKEPSPVNYLGRQSTQSFEIEQAAQKQVGHPWQSLQDETDSQQPAAANSQEQYAQPPEGPDSEEPLAIANIPDTPASTQIESFSQTNHSPTSILPTPPSLTQHGSLQAQYSQQVGIPAGAGGNTYESNGEGGEGGEGTI